MTYSQKLKRSVEIMQDKNAPIWIDGFTAAIIHDHAATENDNPYDRHHEPNQYRDYLQGLRAGRNLLRCVSRGAGNRFQRLEVSEFHNWTHKHHSMRVHAESVLSTSGIDRSTQRPFKHDPGAIYAVEHALVGDERG